MTWVRLKKSYILNNKKRPVGRCLRVTSDKAKEMVNEGIADLYDGPIPPKKIKTEFFKPK
jgi:endonuclease YncB( thermonuclease family)